MKIALPFVTGLAATVLSLPATAGFTNPYVPPYRGTPRARFGGWETFTTPVGGANVPDVAGSTSDRAAFAQLVPGAILTGGDIYHPSATPMYRLDDGGPGDLQEVAFQIATDGNELDYASPSLAYVDGQGQPHSVAFTTHTERARGPGPGGLGTSVESLYTWDLTGVAADVGTYAITFQGASAHVSLDALLLDTRWSEESYLVPFCSPGIAGVRTCPCGNPPSSPDRGCNNFGPNPAGGSGGAKLDAMGTPRASSACTLVFRITDTVITAGGNLNVLFLGTSSSTTGVKSGLGVRCVSAGLKRIYMGNNPPGTGSKSFPNGDSPPQSTNAWVASQSPASGTTRYYYDAYRNAGGPTNCNTVNDRFNLTNAGAITWVP